MKAHILLVLISLVVTACASHERDIASTNQDQKEYAGRFDGTGSKVQ